MVNKTKLAFFFVSLAIFSIDLSHLAAESCASYVSVGKVGISGSSDGKSFDYAIAANLIDFTAIQTTTALGIEISPLAITIEPNNDYAGVTLVNLEIFHRTFNVNGYSILGPFVAIQWLDFQRNYPIFRTGIKFSWRTPWNEKTATKDLAPLFTILDLEAGYRYHTTPELYAAVSIDTTIVAALALICLKGTAEQNVSNKNPGFKTSNPSEEINRNPIVIEQPHP